MSATAVAPGRRARRRLERTTSTSSARREARADRHSARALLWRESTLDRVRKCGRVRISRSGVGVRRSADGVAGLAGLMTCGSIWACPVCNSRVMAARAEEVAAAIEAAARRGLVPLFGTFTMRHRRGQPLAALWQAKSKAWGSVTSGRAWVAEVERYGIAGWLAATEVTHGDHGWHVHLHVVLFVAAEGLDVEAVHARMFGRWSRSLVRQGLAAPLMAGQEMHRVHGAAEAVLGGYFTKQTHDAHAASQREAVTSVSLEVTHTQSKHARGESKGRTPWALLDGVAAGDAEDLDLWHEWEAASHGRRQLNWSRGLRDLLALGDVVDDETLAAEEVGTAMDTLLVIQPEGWSEIVRQPARVPLLLDAAEDGRDRLVALLARWDVPWRDAWVKDGDE